MFMIGMLFGAFIRVAWFELGAVWSTCIFAARSVWVDMRDMLMVRDRSCLKFILL